MTEFLLVSVVLLWFVCLLLGALLFALTRQVGVLHERVAPAGALAMQSRLKVGGVAPRVTARNLNGEALTIGEPGARSTLLFFLSPVCPVCKTLLPALKSIAARERDWLTLVFASDGEGHDAFIEHHQLGAFPYLLSPELGLLYSVGKLPFAALIDEGGRIAGFGLVNTREHIESLFEARELGVASIQEYLSRQQQEAKTAAPVASARKTGSTP